MEHELHPALASTGRFKVRHCLGSGGFGVVYAAYDAQTDANVALKWLKNSDASTIARFKREFRALADIAHPNLVAFRELLSVGGEWFFTMDLVEGVDLLRYVRPASPAAAAEASSVAPAEALGSTVALSGQGARAGSSPDAEDAPVLEGHRPLCVTDLPRLRATLEQLAAGLSALHTGGMLHRDVKPSNVLVNRDGRVVLLDFGLVTELGRDGVAETITGNVVGTPAFMSPEQAMGRALTPASDWYAVGAILYQALTGRLPFEGEPHAVLFRKQVLDPVSPGELVRGVPRPLAELCMDLLSRDPERRPAGKDFLERLAAALPSTGAAVAAGEAHASIEFVGRETHLWALDEALEEAERGKTVIALVHGLSGMGKTALVRHFLDVVRRERPEVILLEGRCYERESVPYKAVDSLADALCRYMQRLPEVEAAALLPRDLASLARVFPVFLQFQGAAAKRPRARPDVVQERRRAFEALRELLARVADRNPVVLFIDDLHWGDADSEPLLLALLRPPDPPPLLLVAAYRSEEEAASPLVRALRRLGASGPPLEVCEIPVNELSPDAARDLATSLLGEQAAARADELARESCGSPLFLRQLAALGSGNESVGLAAAIRQRVAALPVETQRLLEILAVSGRPLPLVAAARAAGIEHDAHGAVAKLRSESLVRTRGGDAKDVLEIYHDRIREVIAAALSEDELADRHRRLARVLSASGNADAEALAGHFLAAGERELAAEYAQQAATRAETALAFDRAARMYEMAIGLSSTLGRDAQDLVLKLAESLVNAGRGRDAAARFLEAARRAGPVDALELRRRAAEQLLFSGHIEEGQEVIGQILQAMKMRAPRTPLGAVLSLLFRRVLLRVRGLRFRERGADQLPRDRLVRIDTCFSLGLGLGMVDPIRGADFQTRYLLLALAAGEPLRIAKGLALEAGYRAADGARARPVIERLLAKAAALGERIGHAHATAFHALMNGVARVLVGDFGAGVELCDRAATELRETCTGVSWELDNACFFAAFSLLQTGRIAELAERLPHAIDDARTRGDLYGEVFLRLQCNWFVRLAADDVAGAEQELAVISEAWSRGRFLLQHAWKMLNDTEVALYRGDGDAALRVCETAWPDMDRSMFLRAETMRVRARAARGRAALAAASSTKDAEEREALLRAAERDAQVILRESWPRARGFGLVIEAGVLVARGDRGAAAERLRSATEELESKEAHLWASAARLRLGQLLGKEGEELVARARREMNEQKIRRPDAMARVFAPGTWWWAER